MGKVLSARLLSTLKRPGPGELLRQIGPGGGDDGLHRLLAGHRPHHGDDAEDLPAAARPPPCRTPPPGAPRRWCSGGGSTGSCRSSSAGGGRWQAACPQRTGGSAPSGPPRPVSAGRSPGERGKRSSYRTSMVVGLKDRPYYSAFSGNRKPDFPAGTGLFQDPEKIFPAGAIKRPPPALMVQKGRERPAECRKTKRRMNDEEERFLEGLRLRFDPDGPGRGPGRHRHRHRQAQHPGGGRHRHHPQRRHLHPPGRQRQAGLRVPLQRHHLRPRPRHQRGHGPGRVLQLRHPHRPADHSRSRAPASRAAPPPPPPAILAWSGPRRSPWRTPA